MGKPSKIRTLLGLLPAGAALSLGAAGHDQPAPPAAAVSAPAAAQAAAQTPSSKHNPMVAVDGQGSGTLQIFNFEGDTVTFRVHARATPDAPWAAEGSFDVTHVRPDGTVLADFGGTVECLMVGDGVAVATGPITRGGADGLPGEEIGTTVGLTIADRGARHDLLGWSWLVMQFRDAPRCMSTAPFFPIADGDFRVRAPHITSDPRAS